MITNIQPKTKIINVSYPLSKGTERIQTNTSSTLNYEKIGQNKSQFSPVSTISSQNNSQEA